LKERDLLVAEGTHFASADKDRASDALTQEGSAERRAPPEPPGKSSASLRSLTWTTRASRTACPATKVMHRLAGTDGSRERAVVSTDDELAAVGGPEHGIDGTTHETRGPHDRIEDRLIVGR
jgi:hypothetical protein